MKLLHTLAFAALLAVMAGCAGLTTKHQKIGAACESAATALEAITAAKVAGRATNKQLQDAVKVYEVGVIPVCTPTVAESLSDVDYDALINAAAVLATKSAEVKP